jgi:predicted transcriptional regulator
MQAEIKQNVTHEPKAALQWHEATKAWEEYQATGLHLTFEEADAWLAELESGNDVEPPACHT